MTNNTRKSLERLWDLINQYSQCGFGGNHLATLVKAYSIHDPKTLTFGELRQYLENMTRVIHPESLFELTIKAMETCNDHG